MKKHIKKLFTALSFFLFVSPLSSFATIHGQLTTCVGGQLYLLADSILGGGPGIWSVGSASVADFYYVGGKLCALSGLSVGTTTITFAQPGGMVTDVVTVSPTPVPTTLTGNTTIPLGSYVLWTRLTGSVGSAVSSSPSIANPTSGYDVNIPIGGFAVGTCTISYHNSCGTSPSVVVSVVPAVNCISGRVISTISSTPYKVWLIKYSPSTHMLEAVDSVVSNYANGFYQFCGVGTDSFRVKASPIFDFGYFYNITSPYTDGPTYHPSTAFWSSASVINHVAGVNDTGKNITLLGGSFTTGPGFIAGDVTMGANKGTAGGSPVTNTLIYCFNSATGEMIRYTFTDNFGHYFFSDLPKGLTYKIYPAELGYSTIPLSDIAFPGIKSSLNNANFVKHILSHSITPIATFVNDPTSPSVTFSVFPNPTKDFIHLHWNNAKEPNASLLIVEMTGRVVFSKTVALRHSNGDETIDLSTLNAGMYFVSLKTGEDIYHTPLQIK